ncbi:type II toxin-antitoxin system VapC family toxin [Candidatus Woesearchaeota archaeon]|nr:type II toxin-antitoxin system VapC family toxin [Candidatus Woesearchaeota archaeon]
MAPKQLGSKVILDSSVIIKWFSEEEDSDKARVIRDSHVQGHVDIIAPDLMLYEITNALRYNNAVTEKDVQDAVDSILELDLSIIVPTREILHNAISIARKHNTTVYDAHYLAIAQFLNIPLITADQKFFQKVKSTGCIALLKEVE